MVFSPNMFSIIIGLPKRDKLVRGILSTSTLFPVLAHVSCFLSSNFLAYTIIESDLLNSTALLKQALLASHLNRYLGQGVFYVMEWFLSIFSSHLVSLFGVNGRNSRMYYLDFVHLHIKGCYRAFSQSGVRENGHFLLPSISWQLIGLMPMIPNGPAHGVPPVRGRWWRRVSCGWRRQTVPGLASKHKLWAIKTLSPKLSFPLTYFGLTRFTENSPQAGNTLSLGAILLHPIGVEK